jgi:hypothetical protein
MIFIVRIIRTINNTMINNIGVENFEIAMQLLAARLGLAQTEPIGVIVCGGSALIAQGLIQRATKDVDMVALVDSERRLMSPPALPGSLLKAVTEVARDMGLPDDWLNNGPSSYTKEGCSSWACPKAWQTA